MFTKSLLLIFLFLAQSGFANDKSIGYIGDGLAVIIPASAYGSTFCLHDHDGRSAFYKSIAVSTATTFGLKFTVKRERPDGSNDRSFPSAHTMYAFQGATFIHQRYGLQYALAAYLGAAFVGYSRIETDKHYLGDVLAGAAIGSLSAWFFTDRYNDVALQPLAVQGAYGIMIAYRW
ncbi:phosphatase PAP2 family protein [Sulfurimonas sp. HSL3-7]|uniref:phosphatase PAP2 family protein n=1 Tax=Sulfonitrofixus jiaomeiensis TaxID=3131938 RepID=UPI0031F867CA